MMCNTIQKKSVAMICRTKDHRDLNFPDFYLSGQVLNVQVHLNKLECLGKVHLFQ